jgi:hypothetical protein
MGSTAQGFLPCFLFMSAYSWLKIPFSPSLVPLFSEGLSWVEMYSLGECISPLCLSWSIWCPHCVRHWRNTWLSPFLATKELAACWQKAEEASKTPCLNLVHSQGDCTLSISAMVRAEYFNRDRLAKSWQVWTMELGFLGLNATGGSI